jgi:phospholipase/carboxylesterase
MALLIESAEENDMILVAPESRGSEWLLDEGDYGPDVQFIDRALERIFTLYNVDPTHVALAGFSSGASFALSLALGNGSLFTHAIGFSPSVVALRTVRHAPRFYIAHGTLDQLTDIDSSSRAMVPAIRAKGFEVLYREFDGGHSVPDDVGADAVKWFMHDPAQPTM